jgi:hypothetical protein
VGEDVVEPAELLGQMFEVQAAQFDVRQAGCPRQLAAARDRPRSRVDPEQARGRERLRQREQVATVAATELQDAAVRCGRRIQTEEATDRLQARGVRRGIGVARVGEALVGFCAAQILRLLPTLNLTVAPTLPFALMNDSERPW